MYRLDYHVLRKIAPAFFALSLLLILALIPFGKTANGATRWIRFGPIGVQPAHVSKTAVIIMLSAAVCAAGSKIKSLWYNFFLFVLIAGFEAILIMVISSNMSSALIILAIAFVMIFVAYPYEPSAHVDSAGKLLQRNRLPDRAGTLCNRFGRTVWKRTRKESAKAGFYPGITKRYDIFHYL